MSAPPGHFAGALALTGRRDDRFDFEPEVYFRGYLSNRDELAAILGISAATTPLDLVRAAYARWGRHLPARLDGQFALVVVDVAKAAVLIAHDALGIVPIYWQKRRDVIRFATRIADLVDPATASELDMAEVERYILFGGAASSATCYATVERLQPGSSLWICDGRAKPDVHWHPQAIPSVRYQHAGDYLDHFNELVDRSVCAALRDARAPWIALSGGLDSNTVLPPALRCRPDLRAYSIVAPQWPDEDETRWMKRVVEQRGLSWTPIDAERILPFNALPRTFSGSPDTVVLYEDLWARLNGLVDGDVLLTGEGGDSFMGSQMGPIPTHLADPLFQGRTRGVASEMRAWARGSTPERSMAHWLVQSLVVPAVRHLSRRSVRPPYHHLHPAWLRRRRTTSRARSLQPPAVAPHCRAPGQQAILDDLWQCSEDTTATAKTYANRHPLFDRKLFEFLWAIPWSQKQLPQCDRYLQRRALKGIIDDDMRTRIGTGIGSRCLIEGLARSGIWRDYLCEGPRLADVGLVDADQWRLAIAQAGVGQTNAEPLLVRAITVEVWLRQLADLRSAERI